IDMKEPPKFERVQMLSRSRNEKPFRGHGGNFHRRDSRGRDSNRRHDQRRDSSKRDSRGRDHRRR
ncbi:MAG: hypothetical protein JXB14_02435, partial [Candidatus Altiarchaeota archaeon]|nr:hypothetical protein [Candidatus Altiarchaeota archaeon]